MSYDPCPKCHQPTHAIGELCPNCVATEREITTLTDKIFVHGFVKEMAKPIMQPWQKEVIKALSDPKVEKIKLVKFSRSIGKTTTPN